MAAMTTPVTELPTTLAEAHALILALAEERAAIEAENSRIASEMATLTTANADLAAVNQAADARIVELTAIVKMLERTLYGTRSERLRSDKPSDEQIAFAFDEIATGVAAIEAELAKAANEGVTLAACFAHVRRRFYELHVNARVVATDTSMPLRADALASAWPILPKPMIA